MGVEIRVQLAAGLPGPMVLHTKDTIKQVRTAMRAYGVVVGDTDEGHSRYVSINSVLWIELREWKAPQI